MMLELHELAEWDISRPLQQADQCVFHPRVPSFCLSYVVCVLVNLSVSLFLIVFYRVAPVRFGSVPGSVRFGSVTV